MITWLIRLIVILNSFDFEHSISNVLIFFSSKAIGNIPFLKQLLKKISAKLLAIIAFIPKSLMAQAACSRLEPHPKFSPASKIDDWL